MRLPSLIDAKLPRFLVVGIINAIAGSAVKNTRKPGAVCRNVPVYWIELYWTAVYYFQGTE
jgi:hypothetical protein